MKILLILPAVLLLAACGGGESDVDDRGSDSSGDVAAATDESAMTTPSVAANTLPFDMPIMDGARYISGSPKFSKPSKRRGGEAIATIAVMGTPLDIVSYYEKALSERGFTPKLNVNNDGVTARVEGVNDKGEKFFVSAARGGSKAKSGESTAALVATLPK